MKIVYNELKEFVEVDRPPAELAAKLSLAGVAIEGVEETVAGPVLEAEVTANRPDCLGHLGIAREVAAIYKKTLKPLRPQLKESSEPVASAVRVDIEAQDLCGRFTARVIKGVKVQPSPEWLRQRLEAIGEKSINNVVDVTNYVMFELGHALHAFDYDKVAEHRLVVRRAKAGEKLKTLDGGDRTLTKEMLVVADPAKALAIAGVMGGASSEIGFSTKNVLLECAWFNPITVRRTSKALGLRSEASYRFERGADPDMAEFASRRAAELIQQVAGGEILQGVVDVYPARQPEKTIELSRQELLRVMGADIPDRDIEAILSALGFHPVRVDENRGADGSIAAVWRCHQVSWRSDVTRGIDLIEEVARHYGYDKFPPRLPPSKIPALRLPHAVALDRLIERVVALGYHEIVEIPIVDTARDEIFRAEHIQPAIIGNPLAEDASVMRSSGVVSMVRALEWNLNHGQRDVKLFEVGKRYELRDGAPVETRVLTLGATGLAQQKTIHDAAHEYAFAHLKGDLDRIGEIAGGFEWMAGGPSWLAPSRATQISLERGADGPEVQHAHNVGVAGQLSKKIADQLKLRQNIFVAELLLEPLLVAIESAKAALRFVPLPRFPSVERDFSLVLDDGASFAEVVETISALGIPELHSIEAADLFRGGQVPKGKFSLMIRVTFQNPQATFTDAQLNSFSTKIVAALEKNLGATLRAS